MKDLHYLIDSYDEKIAKINSFAAPLNFIFITDEHNRLNHMTAVKHGVPYELASDAIDSMRYIIDRCPGISFVVSGGDIGNDYDPDPEKFRQSHREVMDALYRLPLPVHCCIGNHDDGIGNAIDHGWDTTKAAILPDEMHAICMKFNPTPENYYYTDIDTPEKNWRMIFLNTSDKPYYLKNGRYTHGWCSEFSEEQTLWLERDALVTDRDIIVFSHQPLHNEGIFGTEGMPDAVKPYDDLRGGPRVYYDVKKCRNVKMLVAGHVHFDNMLYDDRILSVTSLCSLVQEWSPNCPERVCGTPSETAFDVFSIKGDKVQITRFGAGNDRVGVLLRT